ncbi:hypothetical protein [Bacillus sp. B-jedd]|uniref:hypothetical protein n=1 Tax=Bacillus sp. B-jedd TaxID=1476857 RepID=UPI0005155A2C|nr:hypothetical protein [Bacillus sp. B-jedd]CEG27259.1 hypothetical protein BN1002_02115 [Bacillus sp. B-jedd]
MKKDRTEKRVGTDKMSGGPVGNEFSSDNAFSDRGLENEVKMNAALQKGKKAKE